MPPTADVEASPSEQPPSTSHRSDQHLPAPTMPENHLDNSTTATKDDPATVAASEELKHTTISDKVVPKVQEVQAEDAAQSEPAGEDREMVEPVKEHTPEADPADALDEKMRDRISSPKKKRGRDQDDDTKESDEGNVAEPGSSADPSVLNGSRTTRSAPEKKRPRDTSEEYPKAAEEVVDAKVGFILFFSKSETNYLYRQWQHPMQQMSLQKMKQRKSPQTPRRSQYLGVVLVINRKRLHQHSQALGLLLSLLRARLHLAVLEQLNPAFLEETLSQPRLHSDHWLPQSLPLHKQHLHLPSLPLRSLLWALGRLQDLVALEVGTGVCLDLVQGMGLLVVLAPNSQVLLPPA